MKQFKFFMKGIPFLAILGCFPLANLEVQAKSKTVLETFSLKVSVVGISPVKGNVGLLLFESNDGFPSSEKSAVRKAVLRVVENRLEYSFNGLPPGKYAVAVIHDKNSNNRLDTNFIGLPIEGYGVSNNAINMFGPPKFDQAAFFIGAQNRSIEIPVKY